MSPNDMLLQSTMKELMDHVDQPIQIEGRCSEIIWQHLIGVFPGFPHQAYFDLDDGSQTVIYSKEPITSNKRLILNGKVVSVRGGSKRPRDLQAQRTKVEEDYIEYHVLVDQWKELI